MALSGDVQSIKFLGLSRPFHDDFIQFNLPGHLSRVECTTYGTLWPPPEHLKFLGISMVRVNYSSITNEQRAGMDFIVRGAMYEPV